MKFNAGDLRAAYRFLKRVAFHNDSRLPAASNVKFYAKELKDHGYHDFIRGQHHVWIDTLDTESLDHLLRIMAHEMCHIVLMSHQFVSGNEPHDAQFKELARVIEIEMGWKKGSV